MAFANRRLMEAQAECRRRLLIILPEVVAELEEEQERRQTGKTEIILALRGTRTFLSKLNQHRSTHDCNLSTVVGSTAIGSFYYAMTGSRYLSHFLAHGYDKAEEVFGMKAMEVPFVLRILHRKYERLDVPAKTKEECKPAG